MPTGTEGDVVMPTTASETSTESGTSREGRLVIASNRLPFTLQRTAAGLERYPSTGGLVSALEPVLRKRGGTWVGWPGMGLEPGETIPRGEEPYHVTTVELGEADVTRYLHGFSNRTLWPSERRRWDRFERHRGKRLR